MEVCGWMGELVLICAYAMVSFERISARVAVPFDLLKAA
jgi:hypothetical protein